MSASKTIVYNYFFNYFGRDKYKGKIVCGAIINIAIIPVKECSEIKFDEGEEPHANRYYFNEVFKVSFDRNKIFTIERNLKADNSFRLIYEWERINYEIVGYTLDCIEDCVSIDVTEEEFNAFLLSHIDDFDILDNKDAQVPSVVFIEK